MNFPELKDKICIADGIQGCTTFQIKNENDLERAKKILNEPYIKLSDVEKYCFSKQKLIELIREYNNIPIEKSNGSDVLLLIEFQNWLQSKVLQK